MINMQVFSTLFISILLEAFPFIMLGVVVSSVIHVFVSEDMIRKVIPNNKFFGVIIGAFMGLLFPVCDCAVIPVARRLIKKGVPLHIAITFMLSAPIINPVVILATVYAFSNRLSSMIYSRTIFGVIIAIIVGYIVSLVFEKNTIFKKDEQKAANDHGCCGHDEHDHHQGCSYHHVHEHTKEECACSHEHQHNKIDNKLVQIIKHSGEEFFDVGKFIIIGAFITTGFQVFVPRNILLMIGQNEILSILGLMIFAFVLSLCSTSDSFIAKTFIGQFTNSSILAFLLLGPMIDIKNTIVLLGNFKTKFVATLIGLIFTICFITVLILSYIKIV